MRKLLFVLLAFSSIAGRAYATPYGATHTDDPPPHDSSQLVAPTHWIQQNVAASFNGRFGAISLLSADVTAALGFTPYNATNPAGYVNAAGAASAAPVQSVAGRAGAVTLGTADISGIGAAASLGVGTGLVSSGGNINADSSVLTGGGAVGYVGVPAASSKRIFVVPYACQIPANMTGIYASQGIAGTAATATTNFAFSYIHSGSTTSVGNIVFASSGTVPTFPTTVAINLVAGDALVVTSPATPDATLANASFSIVCSKS